MASHSTPEQQARWRQAKLEKQRKYNREWARRKRAAARAQAGHQENRREEPMLIRLKRRLRSLTIRQEMLVKHPVEWDGKDRDIAVNLQEIADCLATIQQASA